MNKVISILAIAATTISCNVKKSTTNTDFWETRNTKMRDTIIRPVNVQTSLKLADIKTFPLHRWVSIPDTAAGGEIRFLRDSMGKLHVVSVGKDHVIRTLRHETHNQQRSQHTEVVKQESFWKRMGNLIQFGIVSIVAMAFIGFAWRFLWPLFRRH